MIRKFAIGLIALGVSSPAAAAMSVDPTLLSASDTGDTAWILPHLLWYC